MINELRKNSEKHLVNREDKFLKKIENEMLYRSLKGYTDYRLKVQGMPTKAKCDLFEYYRERGFIITVEKTFQGEVIVISWSII